MSEVVAGQPVERLKVACPHCKKPFMVKLPSSMQVKHSVQESAQHTNTDSYNETDGPLSDEEMAFRERVVASILAKNFELPLLPHVAIKVLKLSGNSNSSMQDLAKVIMTDQMMTAKIIKIANSPVYIGSVKVTNVKQALVRVGVVEIRNLMLAVSMGSKVFRSGLYSNLATDLWEQAVGAAFAGRVIAHGLRYDKDQAFLCGLMHNLGKMIMLNILETCQRKERKGFKPSKGTILDLWTQYNADVGELAISTWQLPEQIKKVIRNQNTLSEQTDDPDKMVAIVTLADIFCRMKGIGQEAEDIDLDLQPAAKLLNVTSETCFELLERFYRTYDQMRGEFI